MLSQEYFKNSIEAYGRFLKENITFPVKKSMVSPVYSNIPGGIYVIPRDFYYGV
jgi:hypothetical protein